MSNFRTVKISISNGEIGGFYDPRFERVAEEFERNFHQRGEVGASVCVMLEGESILDLWGGIARPLSHTLWGEDTISLVFSPCFAGVA